MSELARVFRARVGSRVEHEPQPGVGYAEVLVVDDPLATTSDELDEVLQRMAREPRRASSQGFRQGPSTSFGGSVPIG